MADATQSTSQDMTQESATRRDANPPDNAVNTGSRRPTPMRLKSQDHVSDPERTPRLHDLPKIISTLPTPRRLPSGQLATSDTPSEDGDYFLLEPSHLQSAGSTESEASNNPLTPLASLSSAAPSSATTSASPLQRLPTSETLHSTSQQPFMSAAISKKPFVDPLVGSSEPRRIQTHARRFPNQSYSALQYHDHDIATPQSAPGPRTLSLDPVEAGPSRSYVPLTTPLHTHASGTRTAGNSPATTPGLFEPLSAFTPATPNTAGPYSYLNTLQTPQPKETNIADIDVDPISGRKLINDYEIIGELGRGGHGKVKLGRSLRTGQHVAIKIVERYPKRRRLGKVGKSEDKVKREVAILKKARHPNIVALLEVIDDPARKKVYIVLERVDLGEISWRAAPPAASEIALIEFRRFERESKGIVHDPVAEQEDQAILELIRVRRSKAARARVRHLRRTDTGAWSIETAGNIHDDSDLEELSRGSTSNDSVAFDARAPPSPSLSRRSSASASSHAHSTRPRSPQLTRKLSLNTDTALHSGTSLEMHEGSSHSTVDRPSPELSAMIAAASSSAQLDSITEPMHGHETRGHGDNNMMQRAIELVSKTEVLSDLQYVPAMTMSAVRLAFRDTLLGLQYLHYHGVIHRDIKPPNLLQTKDLRIKISDFGVSYLGRPTHEEPSDNQSESDSQDFDEAKELAKTVGTAAFYAPELCYTDGDDDQPPVGKAIDVWALGVTLYCMLFARVPIAESSEYVAMRRIADEKIYIPTKRLLPVGPELSPYNILIPPMPGTRAPTALIYEELDETLLDLLRRLLIKNPQDRITLEEVRHHPWVVADIAEKERWLDETDPVAQARGQKIEVTTEDVEQSVQPINFVTRIRSGLKKAVQAGFGLARSNSRKKDSAAASASNSTPASATSASPVIASSSAAASSSGKAIMRNDETIVTALKASREVEHPLSQSVTASPDHASAELLALTPVAGPSSEEPRTPLFQQLRPADVDKSAVVSSARTIRPNDSGLEPIRGSSRSGSPSPAHSLDSPSASNLGSILGGASRLLKSVRGRGRPERAHAGARDRSSSRTSLSDGSDARASASLAVSTASASGEIDGPHALKDLSTSTSASQSLSSSPAMTHASGFASHYGRQQHDERAFHSRQSSMSSMERRRSAGRHRSRSSSLLRNMSREEDLVDAGDEDALHRRLAELHASQPPSSVSRRSSAAMGVGPSSNESASSVTPEELSQRRRRHRPVMHSQSSMAPSAMPSLENSPASALSGTLPLITPSTSADGMAFRYSFHKPNPSIPTVLSQELLDTTPQDKTDVSPVINTPQTARRLVPRPAVDADDEGYDPDPATDHDNNESSSDSEDEDSGLQMLGRHQSARGRGASLMPNTLSAGRRERRGTAGSAYSKKSRSGSNNTARRIVSTPVDTTADLNASEDAGRDRAGL